MSIVAHNLGKKIGTPANQILADINAVIKEGEFVALTGRSGSGKSTLLYLLSSLDTSCEGSVTIDGHEVKSLQSSELNKFRNENMGFVFQFHYLIAELNALENMLLAARKFGREVERKSYAEELLNRFGLTGKAHRLPRELSGGEQQRVAIARALVMQPRYLFADEPTGSLDTSNGEIVMKILQETNHKDKTTIVMVTHDADFASRAHRKIHLTDGRIL
jgi:putative ABC transport system ATP-binding protein/lipoprotein-releasing system ATP-binding protein